MAAVMTELSPRVAAHLSAALRQYRQQLARSGMGFPAELEQLQELFARIWSSPQEATGDQAGSTFGVTPSSHDPDAVTPETLLTRHQAAQRALVSVTTLKRREAAGELAAVRHGRIVRYRVADIDNLRRDPAC